MDENLWLADRFEAHRTHLRAVAYRILGSLSDADDAVQDTWVRLSRSDRNGVENLGGWLTTVTARICLDMLRTRNMRREEQLSEDESDIVADHSSGSDPKFEALLADSVGLALLVVLDTLNPAERVAFVMHDIFGVPLSQIAPIIGRSPSAARQLASRARRRVSGMAMPAVVDLARQRNVVDAFLAAARAGDFEALLALLHPDVMLHADPIAASLGSSEEMRGAAAVARQFMGSAQAARSALVNGRVGVVVAPRGRLLLVLHLTFTGGKIAAIAAVADPMQLRPIELTEFDE